MQSSVSKWGNSLGVRIPLKIANQLGLAEGHEVEITTDNNVIVIKKKNNQRLEELLAKVTDNNKHNTDDISFVGKETIND